MDTNPAHTGVQVVDRTTVPELSELVSAADTFQSNMDLANAHLNLLGLSPGAIAFDISPAEHKAGNSHYEQVNAWALHALLNARGSLFRSRPRSPARLRRMPRSRPRTHPSSSSSVLALACLNLNTVQTG